MTALQITAKVRHVTEAYERAKPAVSIATVGSHVQVARPTVGTVEETLAIASDITGGEGPGYALIYNADATNYVQVGISTGSYFAGIDAGAVAVLPLDAGVSTLYLKANAAPCELEVWIWER